jgi:DNA-directed RNA polymerase specialized sigma24 family protein
VALVVRAKRDVLLRVYRYQLRPEDLEDCFGQATLELVAFVRRGGRFAGRMHLGNLLEQRFQSRVRDRRRALSGRSPMQAALESSLPIEAAGDQGVEIADVRADLEKLVMLRQELRRIGRHVQELTADQRLVLACQLESMPRSEFCGLYGWSSEKYRKVAQRARARLRALMAAAETGVPLSAHGSEQEQGPAHEQFSPHS